MNTLNNRVKESLVCKPTRFETIQEYVRYLYHKGREDEIKEHLQKDTIDA